MRTIAESSIDKLSANEAAVFLGVSPRHVYDLAAPGGPIPCYRIGSRIVFSKEDLETYLQSCRVEKAPPIRAQLRSTPKLVTGSSTGESALERYCRERGLKPKLEPSPKAKKARR
ncbi:helix-turn-helix domain-containing protein [Paraburkholderia saeva]|uniref:Helix-turn-helix domain-containing protein n=1 Tax=Paraburkholderia saeva TaxID=2777537 RepID=A0A9N8RV64_9BURK|nr:hypothetical protein LMG31841_01573 [Paraburkholderia saeva]